jgi:hypothetical protein
MRIGFGFANVPENGDVDTIVKLCEICETCETGVLGGGGGGGGLCEHWFVDADDDCSGTCPEDNIIALIRALSSIYISIN